MNLNHVTNIFRVCINNNQGNQISGVIYGRQLNDPIPFSDIGNLLLVLDEIMDAYDFPKAFHRKRSFELSPGSAGFTSDESKDFIDEETFASAAGTIATVDISVLTRQNATWQGFLDWRDGRPKESFGSALELIRQIDSELFLRNHK